MKRFMAQRHKPLKYVLWAVGLCLGMSSAVAQNEERYTMSGYVREKGSAELLPGVTIYLPSEKIGTSTNTYGFYSITLKKGSYRIIFSYIGMRTQVDTLVLDQNISHDVSLAIEESVLEEVVVVAEDTRRESEEVQMSKVILSPKTIEDLPSILGEKDVLKVMQLMPGVQSGGDALSGLYVRGGSGDQNLFILDDAVVYNANHLFGFFSVFHGDALKAIELYKGGFPARFGGRLSSVLNVTMKEGNKESWHGKIGIGLLSSQFLIEGPIKKQKSSLLLSLRRSYMDLPMAIIQANADNKISYTMQDLNFKINHEFNARNKLYLSGYQGGDRMSYQEEYATNNIYEGYTKTTVKSTIGWGNVTGTMRWNHQFSPKLFANTSLIASDYKFRIRVNDEANNERSGTRTYVARYISQVTNYTLKYDVDYFPVPNHSLRFGALSTFHRFNPNAFRIEVSDEDNLRANTSNITEAVENALYLEDEMKYGRLQAHLGVRLSRFQHNRKVYTRPEPRISLSFLVGQGLSIKGAYTQMYQYLHLLSISSASLPTDLWVSATDKVKPQAAQQIALGIVKDVGAAATYTLSLESYYKHSQDIIAYKEGARTVSVMNEPNEQDNVNWEDQITTGTGRAYGTEMLIRKNKGSFTGWIGYTLAYTRQRFSKINQNEEFYPKFDRRHDFSLVGTYQINPSIIASLAWVFSTGNNYTVNSYVTELPSMSIHPSSSSEGTYGLESQGSESHEVGTKRYNFRGESYHRLDVNFQFPKKVGKRKQNKRVWQVGVYNTYFRRNPFAYRVGRFSQSRIWQVERLPLFPLIPFITFRYEF